MSQSQLRQFEDLLVDRRRSNGVAFSDFERERLATYYELVLKWNPRLHLTTLTDPFSFFHRHIFESDFAETFILPSVGQLWDLGTGLGIPGIPISVLRPELAVNLVESRRNKIIFLEEAVSSLNLVNTKIVEARIESLGGFSENSCLIARAVEQMEGVVSEMVALGRNCRQLIVLGAEDFGNLFRLELESSFRLKMAPIPESDRRFVVAAECFT